MAKGLKLDVDCISYDENDDFYWNTLASKIHIENFRFDKFFNAQFGIFNLADYKIFFEAWFKNKEPFMRWLLAKYYVYKFCDKGYICRVLQSLDCYSDLAFAKALAITIFGLDNPEDYVHERQEGLIQCAKNGIELSSDIQEYLIKKYQRLR